MVCPAQIGYENSILKINQTAITPRAKRPNGKSFEFRIMKFHEINKTAVNIHNH